MSERPDIIFLSIDALRFDHLSCYGYHRETPTFDTLAENWIDAPITISASSHTREAMPPLLTGQSPDLFHETGFSQLPEEETLAGKLRDAGYNTGGFHSNPYLSRAYNFDRGFDYFYDDLVLGQNKLLALAQKALDKFVFNKGEYYARASEINRRSLEWLDDQGGPVFLWNHYMDVHGPYHAPETQYADYEQSSSEAESLYRRSSKQPDSISSEERTLLIDSYDDEIRFIDDKIGLFLDELRHRDRLEDSLVIVTADHGDAFGEHGYYTHPRYLHNELLRVPLFVSPPSGRKTTIKSPRSTLDVVPTLLSHANVTFSQLPGTPIITPQEGIIEDNNFQISSVTSEGNDQAVRRFCIQNKTWKVRIDRDLKSGKVLDQWAINLENDRKEKHKTIPNSNSNSKALRKELLRYSEDHLLHSDSGSGTKQQNQEINERLKALGYK